MNIEILNWFLDVMLVFAIILLPIAILELFLTREKDNRTEIEKWTDEYKKDVPTVWR